MYDRLLDRIAANPDDPTGKPVIHGTKLTVEFIVGLLQSGKSRRDIINDYPIVQNDDISACVNYSERSKALDDPLVASFPLHFESVWQQYTQLPPSSTNVCYHYTTREGLEGIIKDGGFRASYRLAMNDRGEFAYARKVVFDSLLKATNDHGFLPVGQGLANNVKVNLERQLNESILDPRSYCACLSTQPDQYEQWRTYAANGEGFAIGFDMMTLSTFWKNKQSFGAVIYDEVRQRELVPLLLKTGINHLHLFNETRSGQLIPLTALRDRISIEIAAWLITLIDYIKQAKYSSEFEIRLFKSFFSDRLCMDDIHYSYRNEKSVPYIFIDMKNQATGLMPIAEIKIGPNANQAVERRFVGDLILDLGYGNHNSDWPPISSSECEPN